jgi:PAS domain S-box-containing protein
VRWIEANGYPVRNGQGEIYRIGGTVEDVTERLLLANRLRESESGLRRAQGMARLGHLVTRADGSFESWSESLPALFGVDNEYPSNTRGWLEMVHPDDREAFRARLVGAGNANERSEHDFRLRRPDGRWIYVRHAAEPIEGPAGAPGRSRWFSTFQDITAEREAEGRLRESQRRMDDMLAHVELLSLMVDTSGRITYCNDFLLRLTGWSREEAIGADWFEMFVVDRVSEGKRFRALLEGLSHIRNMNSEIRTRGGEVRIVRWNTSILRDISGEVIGTASIGEDITERHRAEAEVRRLNAELEDRVAERTAELEAANRELEAFDYSISHDLRAPLRGIRGFGNALLEDHGQALPEEGRAYLQQILDIGQHMDHLVGDLLRLSTVGRGGLKREPVDLSAMVTAVASSLRKAEPDRDVRLRLAEGLVVRADAGLLLVVVQNLLGNAWKFTSRRTPAVVEVDMLQRGSERVFYVRDNGAGFDSAASEQLFTPFRRMHAQADFEGTGIGLATVYRIIRRHGGRIWAEAAVDRGATFFFTLPS